MADWAVDRSVNKLVVYFPENVLIGHLAESWENPDPLTYIYKIRDNVFFHDKPPVNGRQLTADDLAANYDRRYGIGRFAGEDPAPFPFGTGGAPFAALESVTATDELTLVFKLSQPNAECTYGGGVGRLPEPGISARDLRHAGRPSQRHRHRALSS